MDPKIATLLVLASINEALTEYLFADIPAFNRVIKQLAMVVGIVLALLFNVDLFPLLGLTPSYPIVSTILTGILISRGSNIINTLVELVKNVKNRQGGVL